MRVRFLKEWRGAKVGGIREIPHGVADLLIRRNIAVCDPIDLRPGELETTSLAPPETAVRKRGRPRKVRV